MDKVAPSSVGLCQYGSVEPGCPTHRSSSSSSRSFVPLLSHSQTKWCWNPRSLDLAMASSSHSAAASAPTPELDPFRDASGFLPLVSYSKCRTKLIGRVSQKIGSKGKRFYKCPLLEHVSDSSSVDL